MRELENVVERVVVMAEEEIIRPEHLPANIRQAELSAHDFPIPKSANELKQIKKEVRKSSIDAVERLFVLEALERNQWNVTRSAQDVGMKRQNFQALMRKYQITPQNRSYKT